ncbi:Rhodanese-like_domain-containing protein [Hexamita inflata]|uniref:Rhodanese-like_domain-containing protein n=1 Tax=Hexamita inflata TaxID=28002 RepID=A0ABP1GIE8_9EUKA
MQYIEPDDIYKYVEKEGRKKWNKTLIIDARESYEYNNGHLKGSVNMPVVLIREQYNIIQIEQNDIIICYSQDSKQRGPYAAQLIKSLYPLKEVFVVKNGLNNILETIPFQYNDLSAWM